MGSRHLCLRWNSFQPNLLAAFKELLLSETLVDVTLVCEGLSLKAHKVVLSASSSFFQTQFLENPCKHPIIIFKDINYSDLKAIVEFMYQGEVNVLQSQLDTLLRTAEMLKVKGLLDVADEDGHRSLASFDSEEPTPAARLPVPPSLMLKGKRKRRRRHLGNGSEDRGALPGACDEIPKNVEDVHNGELPEDSDTPVVTPTPSDWTRSALKAVTVSAPAKGDGDATDKMLVALVNSLGPSQHSPSILTNIVRPGSGRRSAGRERSEDPGPSLSAKNVCMPHMFSSRFTSVVLKVKGDVSRFAGSRACGHSFTSADACARFSA